MSSDELPNATLRAMNNVCSHATAALDLQKHLCDECLARSTWKAPGAERNLGAMPLRNLELTSRDQSLDHLVYPVRTPDILYTGEHDLGSRMPLHDLASQAALRLHTVVSYARRMMRGFPFPTLTAGTPPFHPMPCAAVCSHIADGVV